MLKFQNVDVSVNKTPILMDLSVVFDKGKINTIIGPNGCGKTTLLQTLNGLSTVNKGSILIEGDSYLDLSVRERAKRLSLMPQFRDSAPNISVNSLVEHGRFAYMGFSRKMSEEDQEAIQSALEYAGILEYKNRIVSELSGGLQQRVYLAMQLAQSSDYMVMDEPLNYLDYPSQREMYSLIKNLVNKGKTIILVLHDLNYALRISDKLIIMQDRKIIGEGTTEECLRNKIIQKAFECEIDEININGSKQYIFR